LKFDYLLHKIQDKCLQAAEVGAGELVEAFAGAGGGTFGFAAIAGGGGRGPEAAGLVGAS
jgi:hypothetical protein